MAKYIDAELLRQEIERLKDEYTDIAIDNQMGWVNANFIIDDLEQLQSKIDFLQQEQPEVDLKKASLNVYESWMGGTMNDVRRDMIELGEVLNARKEEKK